MIRSMIKATAAGFLYRSGAAAWVGARSGKAALPLVVGYHRVVEDFESQARGYMPSMLISTAMLERQLDWIGRRYDFADPNHMDRWMEGIRPGRKPVAVVSFDDGYQDVYQHAFPLLKRKGIPALMFVVTDRVGVPGLQLHDELYLLLAQALPRWHMPRLQMNAVLREAQAAAPAGLDAGRGDPKPLMRTLFGGLSQAELLRVIRVLRRQISLSEAVTEPLSAMDWGMLAEMQAAGMRIGSHTQSHALLTNEPAARVAEELQAARRALEQRLDVTIRHFAYPDGRFDTGVVQAVAEAGYRFGYTTCQHRDPHHPMLTIPRRLLWQKACLGATGGFSPAVMGCQVNGVFDYPARCGIRHQVGGATPSASRRRPGPTPLQGER